MQETLLNPSIILLVVIIKKMMLNSIFFISDYRTEIHIFHTFENIAFHIRIGLLQFPNKLLDFQTLGIGLSIVLTG